MNTFPVVYGLIFIRQFIIIHGWVNVHWNKEFAQNGMLCL